MRSLVTMSDEWFFLNSIDISSRQELIRYLPQNQAFDFWFFLYIFKIVARASEVYLVGNVENYKYWILNIWIELGIENISSNRFHFHQGSTLQYLSIDLRYQILFLHVMTMKENSKNLFNIFFNNVSSTWNK